MTREEKTEQLIKILEEYGIIPPPDCQDIQQSGVYPPFQENGHQTF